MEPTQSPDASLLESQEQETEPVKELVIDVKALTALKQKLTETMTIAINGGIKNGVFHVTAAEGDTLMVAADIIEREQIFPDYKLKFYRLGMGAGTNTSAVTFIERNSPIAQPEPIN